jgi:hypothetical protein
MRTLFVIPKMFTLDEMKGISSTVPDDCDQKSKEFWDYVDDRLRSLRSVQRLYYDSLTKKAEDEEQQKEALEFIKKNHKHCYDLVRKFVEAGAKLEPTEDPLLVQEALAWISMINDDKNLDLGTQEMLAKNMIDRDKYIAERISESLKDREIGILFLAPGRQTVERIPPGIRVIKIQPFDPSDYLNSWLVTLSLKKKAEASSS